MTEKINLDLGSEIIWKAIIFVILLLFISGCKVYKSNYREHTHRSLDLTFTKCKDYGFDVTPKTKTLSINVRAYFSDEVMIQFIDPAQEIIHEQTLSSHKAHTELRAKPGDWTVRLLTDGTVTGDYYCQIIEQ